MNDFVRHKGRISFLDSLCEKEVERKKRKSDELSDRRLSSVRKKGQVSTIAPTPQRDER